MENFVPPNFIDPTSIRKFRFETSPNFLRFYATDILPLTLHFNQNFARNFVINTKITRYSKRKEKKNLDSFSPFPIQFLKSILFFHLINFYLKYFQSI